MAQSEKEQFVKDLLKKMTLKEKIGQLNLYNGFYEATGPVPNDGSEKKKYDHVANGLVGGMLNVLGADETRAMQEIAVNNSRLGIPIIFGYDVIHGYKTMAPLPLGQAASWDDTVARKSAQIAAFEASAAGLHWTYAPMVDVTRDARWGRIMESPGEDPYLGSILAKAWVEGFQGKDLSDLGTIAACAKHFAAYGFSEAGRDYNTVDVGLHTLYNMILPPFKAAKEAGVATFMNAFNILNGIPSTGNKFLQRDILKGEWGFEGFMVSDWGSITEMIVHGYSEDLVEAARQALEAGSDMDMESYVYLNGLEKVEGLDQTLLDDAVERILNVKYDLGLFDDPYRYSDSSKESVSMMTKETRADVRDIARKTLVLLKNDDHLLPLPKLGKKIALIGMLGASKDVPLGSWRAQAEEDSAVSLLEGMRSVLGEEMAYAPGYQLTTGERNFVHELTFAEEDESGFGAALKLAEKSDIVVMAMGEDAWQSGEARSQVSIKMKGNQEQLFNEVMKVNKHVVVVLMNGRPLDISDLSTKAPAILETWHAGTEAGNAIADVLFGDYNPSGRLPVSFPRNVGQIPVYYNHFNTGRPTKLAFDEKSVFWSHYTDSPNTPLFPFGYGLSYASFEYGEMKLSSSEMSTADTVIASIVVKNVGTVPGVETVQLYIRDHVANPVRPVRELKKYKQIEIAPEEEITVEFEIDNEMLSFYRADLTFGSEPGLFSIMIGRNALDTEVRELILK